MEFEVPKWDGTVQLFEQSSVPDLVIIISPHRTENTFDDARTMVVVWNLYGWVTSLACGQSHALRSDEDAYIVYWNP